MTIHSSRQNSITRTTCRSCGHSITNVMDFGWMPLAGNFLVSGSDENVEIIEPLYQMQLSFCSNCTLLQIPNIVPKEILFGDSYHYQSSIIETLNQHFTEYAEFLHNYLDDTDNPLVVEFGCNDGVLLSKLQKHQLRAVGVDASANVVTLARQAGNTVYEGFFNPVMAQSIVSEHGKAMVVTGSNVFAHNDDVREIIEAANILLHNNGYFIVEVHHLAELIAQRQFDFFYHEHCNYYSLRSISYLLSLHGLRVIDAVPLSMHSGSLRVIAVPSQSSHQTNHRVANILSQEYEQDLYQLETYLKFAADIALSRKQLYDELRRRKEEKQVICGYGAAGRAVTMLNYYGIGQDLIDFMVDASPLRANHTMPGVHIPIYFPTHELLEKADTIVITAWSFANEIINKEKWLLNKGKVFILPLPNVKIIDSLL
jgi:SAM-dependent methyltransferase